MTEEIINRITEAKREFEYTLKTAVPDTNDYSLAVWKCLFENGRADLIEYLVEALPFSENAVLKVNRLVNDYEIDCLLQEAVENNLDCVIPVIKSGLIGYDKFDLMNSAIKIKDLDLVKKMSNLGAHWNSSSFEQAGQVGSLEIFRYLYDKGCERDGDALYFACLKDHIDILKYGASKGFDLNEDVFGACQSREALEFLIEQGCPVSSEALATAAGKGNLELVNLLIDKGCEVTDDAMEEAVRHGKIEMVKYLRETLSYEWPEDILSSSIYGENCDVFNYCIENGCPLTEDSTLAAASKGKLEMLRLLIERGCPIEEDCANFSADNGFIEIIKLLEENGVEINENTLNSAFEGGQIEMIQYFLEKYGFELTDRYMETAISYDKTEVMDYLRQEHEFTLKPSYAITATKECSLNAFKYLEENGCEIDYAECYIHFEDCEGTEMGDHLMAVYMPIRDRELDDILEGLDFSEDPFSF